MSTPEQAGRPSRRRSSPTDNRTSWRSKKFPILDSSAGRLTWPLAASPRSSRPQPDEPRRGGRGLILAAHARMGLLDRHEHVLLSARIVDAGREVEIHNAHVPNGSVHGWGKVAALELIHGRLAGSSTHLRVLCGDLNTPRIERPDGTVVTWGQTRSGRLRRGSWRSVGRRRRALRHPRPQ